MVNYTIENRNSEIGFDINNENECLKAVRRNWAALQYIQNQTEKICLEAARRNWAASQYIQNQTEKICLEAVKQEPAVSIYVNDDLK